MSERPDLTEHCWEAALNREPAPEVAAHLEGCPECSRRVEAVQRLIDTVRAEIPPPPAGLEDRIRQRVRQEWPSQAAIELVPPGLGALRRLFHGRLPRGASVATAAVGHGRRRRVVAVACALLLAAVVPTLVLLSGSAPETGVAVANVTRYELTPECRRGSVGEEEVGGQAAEGRLKGETIEVAGVWRGREWLSFRKVLERFSSETGARVTFAYQAGNPRDIAATIRARIDQGCPPDVALLPQPGLLADLARKGQLEPVERIAGGLVDENYARPWRRLGSVDGDLYGVWYKAANKSTIWYDAQRFEDAGLSPQSPPRTWRGLKQAAAALEGDVAPFSIAGYDGWTLTDWFENVYLRTAGPKRYDRLAERRIPWTDESVKEALRTLREIWGRQDWIAGRGRGLFTPYEESVRQVFTERKAAMVYEGSFVSDEIAPPSSAERGPDVGVFDFPAIRGRSGVVVGGDVAVLFAENAEDEAARELIRFLAKPEAARPWAEAGGFVSPNRKLSPSSYPDPTTRRLAETIVSAETVRFDLSDLVTPAFGAIEGQGIRQMLRDYLKDPSEIEGVTQRLEDAASASDRLEQAERARP